MIRFVFRCIDTVLSAGLYDRWPTDLAKVFKAVDERLGAITDWSMRVRDTASHISDLMMLRYTSIPIRHVSIMF